MNSLPFHESIVDHLDQMGPHAAVSMPEIAKLIKGTTIPKNHRAIAHAWEQASKRFGTPDYGVAESVLAQCGARQTDITMIPKSLRTKIGYADATSP